MFRQRPVEPLPRSPVDRSPTATLFPRRKRPAHAGRCPPRKAPSRLSSLPSIEALTPAPSNATALCETSERTKTWLICTAVGPTLHSTGAGEFASFWWRAGAAAWARYVVVPSPSFQSRNDARQTYSDCLGMSGISFGVGHSPKCCSQHLKATRFRLPPIRAETRRGG